HFGRRDRLFAHVDAGRSGGQVDRGVVLGGGVGQAAVGRPGLDGVVDGSGEGDAVTKFGSEDRFGGPTGRRGGGRERPGGFVEEHEPDAGDGAEVGDLGGQGRVGCGLTVDPV